MPASVAVATPPRNSAFISSPSIGRNAAWRSPAGRATLAKGADQADRSVPPPGSTGKKFSDIAPGGQWSECGGYQQADEQGADDNPAPVRTALHLREGDALVYSIEGGRVSLTKADRGAVDEPFPTFDEWASDADREAYASL
jgi:antitoxin PrlF